MQWRGPDFIISSSANTLGFHAIVFVIIICVAMVRNGSALSYGRQDAA